MNSRIVAAIFRKQVKDMFKNKEVLIQFILFPIIAVIMQTAIVLDGLPRNYFVILFATMYIGMAPMTIISSILAEEKEKNTLRVLFMSNVKSGEYLLGVGSSIFICCMLGSLVFMIIGKYKGVEAISFLGIMAIGILISILIGGGIGTWSKNQLSATSVTVVVMMIFAFLPMISMFNDTVSKVSRFTFSQQLNNLMNEIGAISLQTETIVILMINLIIALGNFVVAYRRTKLA